jgi:glutamate-1-semialdehyde 2,1-aminomutase/spore coat polysaccharide biosynthesis protein SpsF
MFGCIGPLNDGIPAVNRDLITEVPWNDVGTLSQELRKMDVACVIVEVPPCLIDEAREYLSAAIPLVHKYGALFILDEIVTGFRYALGGVQELCTVTPDLACVGKAMANGYPISAVVGKREHMEHFSHVFFSTTFGGEVTAIKAAINTIHYISNPDVRGIARIWVVGSALMDGLKRVAHKHGVPIFLSGLPPRFIINFPAFDNVTSLEVRSLFLQECCSAGVLFGHAVFPMVSHDIDDVVRTVDAAGWAFEVVAKAVRKGGVSGYLRGAVAQGPHIPGRT